MSMNDQDICTPVDERELSEIQKTLLALYQTIGYQWDGFEDGMITNHNVLYLDYDAGYPTPEDAMVLYLLSDDVEGEEEVHPGTLFHALCIDYDGSVFSLEHEYDDPNEDDRITHGFGDTLLDHINGG